MKKLVNQLRAVVYEFNRYMMYLTAPKANQVLWVRDTEGNLGLNFGCVTFVRTPNGTKVVRGHEEQFWPEG